MIQLPAALHILPAHHPVPRISSTQHQVGVSNSHIAQSHNNLTWRQQCNLVQPRLAASELSGLVIPLFLALFLFHRYGMSIPIQETILAFKLYGAGRELVDGVVSRVSFLWDVLRGVLGSSWEKVYRMPDGLLFLLFLCPVSSPFLLPDYHSFGLAPSSAVTLFTNQDTPLSVIP